MARAVDMMEEKRSTRSAVGSSGAGSVRLMRSSGIGLRLNPVGCSVLLLQHAQHRFHVINLYPLAGNDRSTEFQNLSILDWRLLAHENRGRMVRNHRSQELSVRH